MDILAAQTCSVGGVLHVPNMMSLIRVTLCCAVRNSEEALRSNEKGRH